MASSYIRPDHGLADGKWPLWLVATAFIILIGLRVTDVFAGVIPGADDMMRLQQIRDLLGGQGWFDVAQSRMLTPEGGDMHWSRLPDLFVAGVILLTEPVLGRETAEQLAIGIWPLILLTGAFTFLHVVMERLQVNRAGQVFGFICFATSAAVFNFWPGRIDHHGLVVVLTLAGFAAVLSPGLSARSAVLLALCVTAILSIALEGLPYIAGLIAILGLFWIVRGHREGVRLASFGASLIAFATGFYVLDAPGFGSQRMVCDAYGTSHWFGLVLGGGLLVLLGVFGGALDTWLKRLIAGGLAGALTLTAIVAVNPACLGDPYAAVSDAVRLSWLNTVGEAKTFSTLWTEEPDRIVWVFGFLLVGSVSVGAMLRTADKEQRTARIGFALLLVLSIFTTVWQIRGQSFSHVFAAIGAGWLAGVLFANWRTQGGAKPLLLFALAAVVASPVFWERLSASFALPVDDNAPVSQNLSCVKPQAYEGMVADDTLRIHTPIILSVSVLARTPHEVFAGPYHRNIKGIERSIEVFIVPPELAHSRLLEMGATHLLYCKGLRETNRYADTWPDGLAALLNRDDVPAWLEPVDGHTETNGAVRLYRIRSN